MHTPQSEFSGPGPSISLWREQTRKTNRVKMVHLGKELGIRREFSVLTLAVTTAATARCLAIARGEGLGVEAVMITF